MKVFIFRRERLFMFKFVVWEDTVEVHPYILVTPLERTPVVAAVENIGTSAERADIWATFGGIPMPPQTTPLIEPNSEITYTGEFTIPDVPLGCYPWTFYVGKYGVRTDDEFTQPVIRVVDTIVDATFDVDGKPDFSVIKVPKVALPNQEVRVEIPITIKDIENGDSATADVWTIKDTDKFYKRLTEEGDLTIVDDKVLEIMREFTIGKTTTKTFTKGESFNHTHEFTIPSDLPLGKHSFQTFFGVYDSYFLLNDIFSGFSFDIVIIGVKANVSGCLVYINGNFVKTI